ncbi:MAG: transcriptional regulator [Thaumarchaeota archaeon]|nr:MAG: transcriptional regulator [Nitrososphaerota archaeon]
MELKRIEQRLFERYGLNLTEAIEDFPKLDEVLKEYFGNNAAQRLEKQFLQAVISLQGQKIQDLEWISIENRHLATEILSAFGDEDKKNILNAALGQGIVISDILDICKIPQTSGYRKVNSLIDNGLLISDGTITLHDGKSVNKYRCLFNNLEINFEKDKVVVRVQAVKESLQRSSVIQSVYRQSSKMAALVAPKGASPK